MNTPTASARAAVLDALRLLATRDDLGRDETFVRSVSARPELTAGQAGACRTILARHPEKLPSVLLTAAAEDEPEAPTESPAHRRGRPRIGTEVLSPADRSRCRRAGGDLGVLEVPTALAVRFRAMRDARGWTAARTLGAALDALEASA